jgi:ATP-dependent Lon protease
VDTIEITDEMIEYLITHYTFEPGVRKLKEILFDLYGEVNINIMNCVDVNEMTFPVLIQQSDIGTTYLKKYDRINEKKIHTKPEVGVINGLWASQYGKGGIIPIQTMFFPSSTFLDLKLTGLQGDVMKESMNVAKSLAWELLSESDEERLAKQFEKTKRQGLHIHCPEGAVSKDGPSAGTAITLAILSLLLNKHIKHDVAITGEITLQGNVTEIGGLEDKIVGGIKAGIKTFLFPKSNEKDFKKFMEKYENKKLVEGIQFHSVSTIQETYPFVFVDM